MDGVVAIVIVDPVIGRIGNDAWQVGRRYPAFLDRGDKAISNSTATQHHPILNNGQHVEQAPSGNFVRLGREFLSDPKVRGNAGERRCLVDPSRTPLGLLCYSQLALQTLASGVSRHLRSVVSFPE